MPSTLETKPLLLKDTEAARILGIGRSTFWKWVAVGTFKPIRVGNRITRFKYKDLADWVEKQTYRE